MKSLILSFFAVILGYSLLFNEKEEIQQPIHGVDNSVYIQKLIRRELILSKYIATELRTRYNICLRKLLLIAIFIR